MQYCLLNKALIDLQPFTSTGPTDPSYSLASMIPILFKVSEIVEP